MSITPGISPLIARRAAALVYAWVCGRGEVGYYGDYTGGEFDKYGWVRSGNIMSLSHGVLVMGVSVPAISVL